MGLYQSIDISVIWYIHTFGYKLLRTGIILTQSGSNFTTYVEINYVRFLKVYLSITFSLRIYVYSGQKTVYDPTRRKVQSVHQPV